MNDTLKIIEEFKKLYVAPRSISITNYIQSLEGSEYCACQFDLGAEPVYFRCAKITPTKVGQFVTFWKRNDAGITVPHDQADTFASLIVYTKTATRQGVFIFPKAVLLEHNIISNDGKGGKCGFRVYPAWDIADNVQARKTQEWQSTYFTECFR